MFAARFDSLKRKMLKQEKPVLLKKIVSCQSGTPDYYTYMDLFLMPENNTIEIEVEDDFNTYTFYTIVRDPALIQKIIEREQNDYLERRRSATEASFV